MKRDKDRFWFFAVVFFLMLSALVCLSGCSRSDLPFTSEYQAVFLDNGQVFFGKLSDTGSPYMSLGDVFYVQTLQERDKKEQTTILIKRGSEWHNPDFMRINTRHVVVIEPVGPDSRVAQLIREAKAAPAPKPESSAPAPGPRPESQPPASTPKPSEPKTNPIPPLGR